MAMPNGAVHRVHGDYQYHQVVASTTALPAGTVLVLPVGIFLHSISIHVLVGMLVGSYCTCTTSTRRWILPRVPVAVLPTETSTFCLAQLISEFAE